VLKNKRKRLVFPDWNKLGLANSGPIKDIQMQHCTWGEQNTHIRRSSSRKEHRHNVFHIVVVEEGEGYFSIDGQMYHITKPTLFLTDPNIPHYFGWGKDDSIVYHEFTFKAPWKNWDELIQIVFEDCERIIRIKEINSQQSLLFTSLIQKVIEITHQNGENARISIGSFLYQALFEIYQMNSQLSNDSIDLWEDLRLFIEQHAEEALDLQDLSDRIHLTTKHISRQFASRFGMPPMQYKKNVLVSKAQNFLLSTDYNLGTIANELGFYDTGHFCKVFKQHTGLTPIQFKKKSLKQ
jgi:AraC-like DNA-binding protein